MTTKMLKSMMILNARKFKYLLNLKGNYGCDKIIINYYRVEAGGQYTENWVSIQNNFISLQ